MAADDSVGMGKGSAVSGTSVIVAACFFALSMYNVIELTVLIIATFKKRSGLYFWSFVIATWGVAVHAIGWILKDFGVFENPYIPLAISTVGWYAMVTGQSVVLYSRLHLVVYNRALLRAVLVMIITIAIVAYIPTSVLTFGASSDNPTKFLEGYYVMERLQVTLFFVQEVIISTIYIWATAKILRGTAILGGNGSSLMKHLLWCNVLVIMLNVTILALEFSNLFGIQTSYKAFAYSVKLKVEFSILNRLVDFVRPRDSMTASHDYSHGSGDGSMAQLGSADVHHTIRKNIRERMKLGHRAKVHSKQSRGRTVTQDVDSARNGVVRTTEIVVTTDRATIALHPATETAPSETTGDSTAATGEDPTQYSYSTTSHMVTEAHLEHPAATHAARDPFSP